ncbi:MAG: hypothetical protein P4K93_15940, partial [Terracidiphilus sp.]|nr:hypothetical protein [Terracidiphilus sp.]
MIRALIALSCLLSSAGAWAAQDKQSAHPSFDYQAAYTHEIKPHRRTIPVAGVSDGGDQLGLTLTVSPAGAVLDAKPAGEERDLKLWPA